MQDFPNFTVGGITAAEAITILSWRYPEPYDFYNPPASDDPQALVREFLKPANGFCGVRDTELGFVGFCSFGLDGQVPGGDYLEEALDIGLGMQPELIHRGLGTVFCRSIMRYARDGLGSKVLRLTVADFNVPAIRIYDRLGFIAVSRFVDPGNGLPHTIMVRRE